MERTIDESVIITGNATVQGNAAVGGDQSVSGNINIGGKTTIQQGDMVVNGNMKVKGWLDVTNLNFPAEGVFASVEKLNESVAPKPGHIAGVIEREQDSSDFQVQLYIVDSNSEQWVASGHYLPIKIQMTVDGGDVSVETLEEWQRQIEAEVAAKANVAELEILTVSGYQDRKVVQLTSDTYAAFLTEHQDISGKANVDDIDAVHFNGSELVLAEDIEPGSASQHVEYVIFNYQSGVFIGVYVEGQELEPVIKYYALWDGFDRYNTYYNNNIIIRDRVFIDDIKGKIYYRNSSNALTEAYTSKADKVTSATNGNFPTLNASGNLVNSQYAPSSFAPASHTHSGYEVTTNKVTSLSGSSTHTQYPSAKTVYDNLLTKIGVEELGRAIGEAIRCYFVFDEGGEYTLCQSDDLLMAVVDGVGVLPEDGAIKVDLESAGELTVAFIFKEPATIPEKCFKSTAVKNVHLPSYIHNIKSQAFADCVSLTEIDCEAMTPPTFVSDAFDGVDMGGNVTLTVHSVVQTLYDDGNTTWGGVGTVTTY